VEIARRCGIKDILRSNKIQLMKAAEEGCLGSGVLESMSFWWCNQTIGYGKK
jgi:hypothetical protein